MSQSACTAVADASAFTVPMGSNRPGENLMDLALGFLVPLVMAGGIHDPVRAHQLALATVTSYGFGTEADVIKIMQIVGFGLGAMDNLRLAVTDAGSVSLKLRLRGCANGLHRSAQQNNQTLEKDRRRRGAGLLPNGADAVPEQGAGVQACQADAEAAEAACQAAIDMARQKIAAARAGVGAAPVASSTRGPAAEAHPVLRAMSEAAAPEVPHAAQVAAAVAVPQAPTGTAASMGPPTVAPVGASVTSLGEPQVQAIKHAVAMPAATEAGAPQSAANVPASQTCERLRGADVAQEARSRLIWASAMTDVAAELQTELIGQSPAERAANQGWINSLTEAAGSLAAQPLHGRPQRPSGGVGHKSGLLSSTTLGGPSGGSSRPPAFDARNRPLSSG